MRSLQFQQLGINFFGVNAKCHRVIERFRFFSTSFQVSKDRLFRFFFRRQLDACSKQCSADGSSDAAEFWRLWRSRLLQLDVIAVVRLEGVSRSNSNEGRQGTEEGEGQGVSNKSGEFFWWEVDKNATILMFCVEGKGCHLWMSRGEVYPSA